MDFWLQMMDRRYWFMSSNIIQILQKYLLLNVITFQVGNDLQVFTESKSQLPIIHHPTKPIKNVVPKPEKGNH